MLPDRASLSRDRLNAGAAPLYLLTVPSPANDPFKHGEGQVGLRAVQLAGANGLRTCGDAFMKGDVAGLRVTLVRSQNLSNSMGRHENARTIDVRAA